MTAPTPRYLTTNEVAERFRTNANTVRQWRHRGFGPQGVPFGRRVLYPLPEVERWEREQVAKATGATVTELRTGRAS